MQIIFSSIITVALAITGVYAFNDWNVPCISGVCHYDLDHSKGGSSGTIQIWGSHKAISDITPAAGWHVLDCDEDEMEQVIRIVCVSQSAPCSHLFSHDGPEGKLIRMPEGCGRNPFARVAKAWVSYDQSLPRGLAAQLRKIDGLDPVAYNLALDVNFDAVDARHGPVRFAIQAATIPNTDTNIDTHLPLYKRSGRPVERSHKDIVARSLATVKRNILEHFHDAEQTLNNAFNKAKLNVNKGAQTIKNHVVNAAATVEKDVPKVQAKINSVEKAAVEKAEKVKAAVKQDAKNVKATVEKDVPKVKAQIIHGEKAVVNAVEHPEATARKLKAGAIHGGKAFVKAVHTADANAHKLSNYNKTIHFSPQLSGHNTTLFKGTFNCKPMYPGLEVDLNPNGNMTGTIGIAASGTLIPPNLAEFRIVIDFSADVDAVLTINAELTILFDSGQHKLFGIPIAGIKIPGIFSIGPEFELLVQLRILYDIAIGTRLGFGIQVENLHIELPKTQPMPHPKFKLTKGSISLRSDADSLGAWYITRGCPCRPNHCARIGYPRENQNRY
ncbi:hypothetical protein F5887DRAFT_237323 [Amanita rubescens]|nr:hypothetical protein F5887DRAFT_237323 [Amanita rubescens]